MAECTEIDDGKEHAQSINWFAHQLTYYIYTHTHIYAIPLYKWEKRKMLVFRYSIFFKYIQQNTNCISCQLLLSKEEQNRSLLEKHWAKLMSFSAGLSGAFLCQVCCESPTPFLEFLVAYEATICSSPNKSIISNFGSLSVKWQVCGIDEGQYFFWYVSVFRFYSLFCLLWFPITVEPFFSPPLFAESHLLQ